MRVPSLAAPLLTQVRALVAGRSHHSQPASASLHAFRCVVQVFDIETGSHNTVYNANPQGWDSLEDVEQVRAAALALLPWDSPAAGA